MPLASAEKIRSGQERLSASMRNASDALRHTLLENGAVILTAQKQLEQDLREWLREGVERKELLDTLATLRPQVEHVERMFERGLVERQF